MKEQLTAAEFRDLSISAQPEVNNNGTKSPYVCETAEEYYSQFHNVDKYDIVPIINKLDHIRAELLEKHKIYFVSVGWSDAHDFADDADHVAFESLKQFGIDYESADFNFDSLSLLYTTDFHRCMAKIHGSLSIHHQIRKQDKAIVKQVFEQHFGGKLIWPKKQGQYIKIKI